MKNRFEKKVVLVIGAAGGLGRAFFKAFSAEGAVLILAGRNMDVLQSCSAGLKGPVKLETVDITQPESIQLLCERVKSEFGYIDIVVNAAGYDVRKSLASHTIPEIERELGVDLLGPILITRIMIPYMRADQPTSIVHIGGFADGRLAFPYYSVDAASRAGLFTFIESMNRELALEGCQTRLIYFCPSPADTDAEKPFHPLWQKMGIQVISVEKVAQALLQAVAEKRTVSIMGGFVTVLFAKINAVFPGLANVLMMNTYGKMLQEYLYGSKADQPQTSQKQRGSLLNRLAVILVILSFLLYGLIAVVPVLSFTLAQKAVLVSTLVAGGEIAWWIGVAIVGKQMVEKYRKYLNPCTWLSCIKTSTQR
jgi:short-subunit dehydrogenase